MLFAERTRESRKRDELVLAFLWNLPAVVMTHGGACPPVDDAVGGIEALTAAWNATAWQARSAN